MWFVSTSNIVWKFKNGKLSSCKPLSDLHACAYNFWSSSTSYPIFDDGCYFGWSNRANGTVASYNASGSTGIIAEATSSRSFKLRNTATVKVYENGVYTANVSEIIFGTDGRLLSFKRSTGYYYPADNSTITFSCNHVNWTFRNKKFVSAVHNGKFDPRISVPYYSGTIDGKNDYDLIFKLNGYIDCIEWKNVPQSYPAGENWINVSAFRVYWDYNGDPTNYYSTSNTAQIGTEGTIGNTTRVDKAQSTINGTNQLKNTSNLLVRVVGEDKRVHWLYDGRMTSLTDSRVDVEI